jgi:hypothetical protein
VRDLSMSAAASVVAPMTSLKVELHGHSEGTVRAEILLQIAKLNSASLPANSLERPAGVYHLRDFAHFHNVWLLTTATLRAERDFRPVVDYAAEAAS